MAHIDEGTLQAYLDDEVGARAEIDQHLAACTQCAAELTRLESASRLFAAAVHSVDGKARTLAALAEVRARVPRPQPLRVPQAPRGLARFPLARAALFIVGLSAVASAAIPGSPVRALIASALRAVTGGEPKKSAQQAPPESREPVFDTRTDVAAALSIQPVGGRVVVRLSRVDPAVGVHVREFDGDRATVQATGAAAHARFRTGPGRIEVVDVAGGEINIDVPRSALSARVEVDGKVIFQK